MLRKRVGWGLDVRGYTLEVRGEKSTIIEKSKSAEKRGLEVIKI